MKIFKRRIIGIFDWLVDSFLCRSKFLSGLCQRFLDICNGRRNWDMRTNGEVRLIKKYAKNWHVVFDIGANQGEWTRAVVEANSHVKIHCFEPDAAAFRRLVGNNFSSNVLCNNLGLSSAKQELSLHIFSPGSAMNSLYKREGLASDHGSQDSIERVKLDTFENYCRIHNISFIDFVKIDVEGHEFEVLKGMKSMLENNQIGMIQFEYGGCYIDARVFLRDIFTFFQGFDYVIYKIFPKRIALIEHYKESLEDFIYANYLVVQKNLMSLS